MLRDHDRSSRFVARESADAQAADPLSDVLRTVHLTGAVYFVWEISSPHVTAVPDGGTFAPIILPSAQQIVSYHIVTKGSCWGSLSGEPPVLLQAGDILLIPHGDEYAIGTSARMCERARPQEAVLGIFHGMAAGELPFVVSAGGRGRDPAQLVCGFLGCDVRPFNPVLGALPRLVHVRPRTDAMPERMRSLLDYTVAEARHPSPGSQSVLVRLSELMFVEVVRRYLTETASLQSGWLAGLRDPIVGRALTLLHRTPAAPWTLVTLATRAGVSRSRLAETFTRFVGEPPMQYLARWRLQLAARMLDTGSNKIAAVAREVGYESEAAFSRAFKRVVGVPPSRWRARRR